MPNTVSMLAEALRDGLRRARFMGVYRAPRTVVQAEAELQKDLHVIERALALPKPRRPFGAAPATRIDKILRRYGAQLGEVVATEAARTLGDLTRWNEQGVRPVATDTVARNGAERVLVTRRSVRAFRSGAAPTESQLEAIIELAVHAPSVSNTQSWRVHRYRAGEDIARLLTLQNGHAGNSPIPLLLVVTVDIRGFAGAHERNQMWIDGGIFLHSLLLSIHAKGWASCPLNFSSTNAQARALRKMMGIPAWEEIVCFVAVGEEDPTITPARSARKSVHEILRRGDVPR